MKTVFSTLSLFLSRLYGALVANTTVAGHSARPKRLLPALGSYYGHALVLDVSASTESGLWASVENRAFLEVAFFGTLALFESTQVTTQSLGAVLTSGRGYGPRPWQSAGLLGATMLNCATAR